MYNVLIDFKQKNNNIIFYYELISPLHYGLTVKLIVASILKRLKLPSLISHSEDSAEKNRKDSWTYERYSKLIPYSVKF